MPHFANFFCKERKYGSTPINWQVANIIPKAEVELSRHRLRVENRNVVHISNLYIYISSLCRLGDVNMGATSSMIGKSLTGGSGAQTEGVASLV